MIAQNSGIAQSETAAKFMGTSLIGTIYKIKIEKTLSILGYILILSCLYVINRNSGVQGYEISIYDVYPLHQFWYCLIISIFIFGFILILNIARNSNSSISWKNAIIGLVMANSILLLLPLIRQYALMGSGDPATHMGLAKNILYTGYTGGNAYPMNHILACMTHFISYLDLNICMMLFPFIFYSLYILSFYLLLRILLQNRISILVGMILVPSLVLGGSHFTPQAQSNFFLPLVFYIYFLRYSIKNALNYSILIIICSIAITFYHPLTTLFLIFSFSIIKLVYSMYKNNDAARDVRDSSYIIMILITIFLMWQSYASILFGTFRKVYEWLYDESSKYSMFEVYTDKIAIVQPDPTYLIISFIYSYGQNLLLIVMGIISILITLYASRKGEKNIELNFLIFSLIFTICALLGYGSFFIVTGTGYGRVLTYALFASIFLIANALGYLLSNYRQSLYSLKLLVMFSILMLIVSYLSAFTLYHSPIIKYPGQHVADSQIIGINTFFETRNEDLQLLEGGLSVSRMKQAIYGTHRSMKNIISSPAKIPDHFGYQNVTHFANNYRPTPMYLVINTMFRISNQVIFPEYPERWRFNQMDFLMLENDVTVSKTYSNRGLDIYLLNPTL